MTDVNTDGLPSLEGLTQFELAELRGWLFVLNETNRNRGPAIADVLAVTKQNRGEISARCKKVAYSVLRMSRGERERLDMLLSLKIEPETKGGEMAALAGVLSLKNRINQEAT